MKLFLTTTFTLLLFSTYGQQLTYVSNLESNIAWHDGFIILENGQKLKGLIKYNLKNEILAYENGPTSRSFTPKHITGFEFFDESKQERRTFYSLPFEDSRNNIQCDLFFEVILELKEFVLISKTTPLRFNKREYTTPAMFNPLAGSFSSGRYYGYPTTFSSTETIFLLSRTGKIMPFLEIIHKDIDGMFFDRCKQKNKILDGQLMKEYTNPHYKQLEAFANKNNLSFRNKKDLIRILEYYRELEK